MATLGCTGGEKTSSAGLEEPKEREVGGAVLRFLEYEGEGEWDQ